MRLSSIPVDLRVPGTYLAFDATRASASLPASLARLIVIGHKLAGGTAAPGVPVAVRTEADARELFGAGAMLTGMCAIALNAASLGELIAVPTIPPQGATAATATVTLAGPAAGAGTVDLRIAGRRYTVVAAVGDTAATLAVRLRAEIDADADRAVTTAIDGAKITLTARHAGLSGNSIDVRIAREVGVTAPAGVAAAIVAFDGGAGEADLTAALAALDDTPAQAIAVGIADPASLALVIAALESRQGPTRMIDGGAIAATRGSVAQLVALSDGMDSPYLAIADAHGAPTSPWHVAAALGAVVTAESAIDPARPLHTLTLAGTVAEDAGVGRTLAEREALLRAGVSTLRRGTDGQLVIERLVTTAKTDGAGNASTALANVETIQTLGYLRRAVRHRLVTRFARHKLADDGTNVGSGQAVVTPSILRAELVALMRELEEAGLVENVDAFRDQLRVERDPVDRDRVNALLPPDLVNQLRVVAVSVQFRG